jgi:hypothetical protein
MTSPAIDEERARELRQALVPELVAMGAIRSEPWRRAFMAVPRHAFVSTVYRNSRTDGSVLYELDDDWLERVYSDDALVTQVDRTSMRATSSSTTPSLMASMLEALDVDDAPGRLPRQCPSPRLRAGGRAATTAAGPPGSRPRRASSRGPTRDGWCFASACPGPPAVPSGPSSASLWERPPSATRARRRPRERTAPGDRPSARAPR